jgi:NTE family protein
MNAMQRIGLALSGGGVRAMAFHAGVLRWLAETNRLENVVHISSVSGGSLLTGLIFKLGGWKWPTSRTYLESVQPEIRALTTEVNTQLSLFLRLLLPINWRYLLSRANVVSQTIEQKWGVDARLSKLPEWPEWSINGTTAETGRRFRFKRTTCGDYELGYAFAKDFKIADAMAVSAAFPVGIGPLSIRPADYEWYKRPSWDASPAQEERVQLPYKYLHLYDGGVYDNLGMEPLFDAGEGVCREGVDYVLVSDAGAPFQRASLGFPLSPFRVQRILDITMDQIRALRVRTFMKFLISNPSSGIYMQIGMDAKERIQKYRAHNEQAARELLSEDWLNAQEVARAAAHPTTLWRLKPEDFDRLAAHGYQTAKWNERLFTSSPVRDVVGVG